MAFYVGQKVVCVDDSPYMGYASTVKLNHVYTIKEVIITTMNNMGLLLVEAPPPLTWEAFNPRRFRPIVETDISIFTAMLTPKKIGANA